MATRKFLITGGAGFIGARLASRLKALGEVTVFDNLHPQAHDGNPENRAILAREGIRLILGDVRDAAALQSAVATARPDTVFHLAAETGTGQSFDLPARYNDVNVMGTAHLIEAIRSRGPDVRRVILAASRSVYGEGACVNDAGQLTPAAERRAEDMKRGDFRPRDAQGRVLTPVKTNGDCAVAPASIYASTKLMQEYLLKQAFWGSPVSVGVLRLQNVYGPGQSLNNPYTGVLSIFCRQIQEGRTLNIFEDGEITRDFVLVDDVVSAFVRMAEVEVLPEAVLDIGSGEAATIADVARRLLRLFGASTERLRMTGEFRPGDIRHAVADISRATASIGWTPHHSLDEGLAQLVAWSQSALSQSA